MHLTHVLGYIITPTSNISGGFGSFNTRRPRPVGSTGVHLDPASFPVVANHWPDLFIQSHTLAFSVVTVVKFMAFHLAASVTSTTV